MADLPVESTSEEVVAVPRKVGHARFDLILALAAIAMSAISLVVAIQNSLIQRELVAASTWPFVQRNLSSRGADDYVTIGITNDGVGPAKIRSVEIMVDGKPVRSIPELLRACCGYRFDVPATQQLPQGFVSSLADNTVLRSGESNEIIRVPRSDTPNGMDQRLGRALPRISFRGCYCSVLGRCWSGDLASVNATPVAACGAPAHPFDPIRR